MKKTARESMIAFNILNGMEFPELQKCSIADFWIDYGGSFISKIGEALHYADMGNERIIRNIWKENIKEHYDIILSYENKCWKK